MLAALYVDSSGPYANIDGVEVWCRQKDARTYSGPLPVIAHPPCQRWGKMWGSDADALAFHNVFPSRNVAKKASKLMRRSNAIIRACLLVDPDFEADFNNYDQLKFYPVFADGRWAVVSSPRFLSGGSVSPAHISTWEKGEEVIKLLEKWGVK